MFAIRPFTRNAAVYDPFDAMDAFRRAFAGDMFGADALPSFKTDIRRDGDNYVLEADLPGFAKEDIKLELSGDILTIKAERKTSEEKQDDNGNFIRRERSYGSYVRSFDVSEIEKDAITAAYENGVLTLTMPGKKELEPVTRQLEIM